MLGYATVLRDEKLSRSIETSPQHSALSTLPIALALEDPICQVCQVKKAAVSFSCWRSDRFLDRTFVCTECAPAFDRLTYGGPGMLGDFVLGASAERAREAGIDPSVDCPGCGTTLVTIVTEAEVGCEMCYERFRAEIAPTIDLIQGWGSHVGKSPRG